MPGFRLRPLFASPLYRARLGARALNAALEHACLSIGLEDVAGQCWRKEHGYTFYASLDDLPERTPEFSALVRRPQGHAQSFCRALAFDLDGQRLRSRFAVDQRAEARRPASCASAPARDHLGHVLRARAARGTGPLLLREAFCAMMYRSTPANHPASRSASILPHGDCGPCWQTGAVCQPTKGLSCPESCAACGCGLGA